jgi:hypothetical protein
MWVSVTIILVVPAVVITTQILAPDEARKPARQSVGTRRLLMMGR